ncbi:hypothetical protein TRVL_05886 [Trypanosoma vivax]|nr:hypothetical protein TRVL_05886 [Trypanosoma vivax]
MKQSGVVQVSPSKMKGKLCNLLYCEEGKTMANDTVDCIVMKCWQGSTQLLVEDLKKLIKNSSSVCAQRVQPRKGKEDLTSCLNYAEARRFAGVDKMNSLTTWTRLAALIILVGDSVTFLTTSRANFWARTLQSNSNAF